MVITTYSHCGLDCLYPLLDSKLIYFGRYIKPKNVYPEGNCRKVETHQVVEKVHHPSERRSISYLECGLQQLKRLQADMPSHQAMAKPWCQLLGCWVYAKSIKGDQARASQSRKTVLGKSLWDPDKERQNWAESIGESSGNEGAEKRRTWKTFHLLCCFPSSQLITLATAVWCRKVPHFISQWGVWKLFLA